MQINKDKGVKRNVNKEISPKEILNLQITGTNEKYQTISKAQYTGR